MSESVAFIFKTLIKVPIIIFTAFFIMNCFAFAFIYFKVLGFSYVLMQEAVENNYVAPRQADQIRTYLWNLQDEIPMCRNATIIVGLDSTGTPVLWNMTPTGAVDLQDTVTGHHIGNLTYGDVIDEYNYGKNAGIRQQYGATKSIGIHCEYEFVWPLSYQYTHGQRNVDGYTGTVGGFTHSNEETGGNTYDISKDPYTLNGLGDFADSAGMSESAATIGLNNMKGVIIPIDIYYTVPGLKYYADL